MNEWIEYKVGNIHPEGAVRVEIKLKSGAIVGPMPANQCWWVRTSVGATAIIAYRYVNSEDIPAVKRMSLHEMYDEVSKLRESDPSGISQHASGAKLDAGKPRAALVLGGFARALMEVIKVGTEGAAKYTDDGWKEVENGQERYASAGLRHFLYRAMGAEIDPDFDLDHAAHKAWNALAELELILQEREK